MVFFHKALICQRKAGIDFQKCHLSLGICAAPGVNLLINGRIVCLCFRVELCDLGVDKLLRQAQGDVLQFTVFVQAVDSHAVKELQKLALVVIKIIEAGGDTADQCNVGVLHLFDGTQCGHSNGKAAKELGIIGGAIEPLGRNVVVLQIMGNNRGIHVDATQRIVGYNSAGAHFRNCPQAQACTLGASKRADYKTGGKARALQQNEIN